MKRPLAYVAGTGRGLPAGVMTNHDFAAIGVDEAIESGRIRDGSTVLLVTFGAGFTWASMVMRF